MITTHTNIMNDPITYILGSLVVSFATILLSKSYYARRGDRRKGYCELEVQVKQLSDYVKNKVHTSKQVHELELTFNTKLDAINHQVTVLSGFMKSLIDNRTTK